MKRKFTRRQALGLFAAGGLGSLAAACSSRLTETPAPSPRALPSPTRLPNSTTAPTATPAPATEVAPATQAAPTATTESPAQVTVRAIEDAAANFLEALNEPQRLKATYPFTDVERLRWHWTTPRNFPRNGLPLRELEPAQRDLALGLLQASSSAAGLQKSLDIISLQNDLGNDPELYYVTVFGEPGSAQPWGWRFEGHHLSRHFTIAAERMAVTPFFLGAWPTVNDAGLKAMEREEWAARELISSLDEARFQSARFQERSLTRHVTQNEPYVSALEPVGLAAGELNPDQSALMLEIIQTYLNTLPEHFATAHFGRLQTAGLDNIHFGWAGPLEARNPHYYRLQGPSFLLEFDNSRGGGTHIHSVWRDFAEDFGQHLA